MLHKICPHEPFLPRNSFVYKSTSVQAANHYLSQCWHRFFHPLVSLGHNGLNEGSGIIYIMVLWFLNRAQTNAIALTSNSISIKVRLGALVQHSITWDSDDPVYCHKSPGGLDVSTPSCMCQKVGWYLVQVMVFTYSVPRHHLPITQLSWISSHTFFI